MPQAVQLKQNFRPEIQGLRAVAALLVAAYHIWLGRVSGGVDVFIVVSAFLITTSLLRQADDGRIDFLAFWSGLARRLLPSAITVLLAIVVASMLWMPRERWIATIADIAAATVYMENWLLAFRSVDYLAGAATASPVQHFWAMAVQGQLYVVWPVIMAIAILVARTLRLRVRAVATAVIGTLFLMSLAYSVIRTASNQAFTYFDTFARLWEFALGALFALAAPSNVMRPGVRFAAGWIGLIGLIACGIVLQVSSVFPGYAALWPTGAGLLVLASHGDNHRWSASRLLSQRPLMWLGDRSYAIYLWHWPILVFYRILTHSTTPSLGVGALIMGAAIILAAITTDYIETPIRSGKGRPRMLRPVVGGALGFGALVIVLGAWGAYALDQKRQQGRVLALEDPLYPGAAIWRSGTDADSLASAPIHPGPMAVKSDRPSMLQGDCFQNIVDAAPVSCVYGDSASNRVIAAVGGSYVAHWIPALERFAHEEGWKVVTYTKNRCWFSTDERIIFGRPYESCVRWNENVIAELMKLRPALVFTRATRGTGRSEQVPEGAVEQWRRLTAAGIRVVAIRNTPRFPFDVPGCVARYGRDAAECTLPRAAVLASEDPVAEWVERLPGVRFIDLTNYFCDSLVCPPVIGNILVYSDDSHMTTHYARTLAPMLTEEMKQLLSAEVDDVIEH